MSSWGNKDHRIISHEFRMVQPYWTCLNHWALEGTRIIGVFISYILGGSTLPNLLELPSSRGNKNHRIFYVPWCCFFIVHVAVKDMKLGGIVCLIEINVWLLSFWIMMYCERNHSKGRSMDRTQCQIKDKLGHYCPKTLEAVKGMSRKWCCLEHLFLFLSSKLSRTAWHHAQIARGCW